MPDNNNRNNDIGTWIAIVVLFCIPYTFPIALFLLIRQLMGYQKRGSWRDPRVKRHPYDLQQDAAAGQNAWQAAPGAQSGADPDAARKAAERNRKAATKTRQTAAGLSKGKGLTIAGAIVGGIFGFSFIPAFLSSLVGGTLWSDLGGLATVLGFAVGGLVMLGCGVQRTKKSKRFRKYLALVGKQKVVSVADLALAMPVPVKVAFSDLQDMLDDGLFPSGYLDYATGELVLSDEGIHREEKKEEEKAPEKSDEYAVLQEIKEVNDTIPDPEMSRKIDRIGEITGKILDYQRSHPEKAGQLRSFLNYYLPTTLKVLRAYAQLDAQGIEGENITAAKRRIEGTMDQVVDGFEKQLDKLFQADAMDITTDVDVLENMMKKDGLSGGDGMTLGG